MKVKAINYFIFISANILFSISVYAQNTVIKAGHLFDSRTGKFLSNQIIVVKDGKILEVGSNVKYTKGDKVIDLSNSWILPGLMDCHAHITSNFPFRNVGIPQ